MASCGFCKSTILFGGISDGPTRYCNQKCHQSAMLALAADAVPPDILSQAIHDVYTGTCPTCSGPGPVDVHTSYFVWSALVMTGWKNTPGVSCRACARKRQIGAALGSAVVGWWGFPWGLVMTPVQVGRNIAAMTGGPSGARPSPDLERMVRMQMGARLIAMERQRLASGEATDGSVPAAPPTAPPTRR
jgi:hypothetical protein